ncbi:ATP-binding cassette, subfamily B, multidrug efflux pump [Desulfosarcina sp. BuS5]|nr:ATP-binding cassette, subfamily B, multidrug efflux pump [Desulfosarcina sp. BuS5]
MKGPRALFKKSKSVSIAIMKSFNIITPYLKENLIFINLGLFCLIIVDFIQLFIPRIIKWAVDDISSYRIDPHGLLLYASYITGSAILIGIFRYIWRRCLLGMSRRVEEGLRNRLFEHIQTLSASYFGEMKTGDLMAHATNDIMHIRMATGMGIVALTDALVLGTAAIGFMAYINGALTLLVFIPMPFLIFGTRFFSKKMHQRYGEVQSVFADLTEAVRERFAGIRTIKAYNMEKEAASKVASISKTYIAKKLALIRIVGSFFPMMVFFSNLSLAIVLYIGGKKTIALTITPGDFVAFISYLGLLTWPMMATGWVINLIQRGKASMDRIDKILKTEPEIKDFPEAQPVNSLRGNILIKNVSFSYKPGSQEILSDVNINLEHGKILGIVGPPGGGKSTLLNLLPRLFDVSDGIIALDGNDIRSIKIRDLRSMIAFVPQEPFLFSGTIRENICFGISGNNDSELIEAATEASFYETIKSFPDGFETFVGEKGVILSGGQKQRIALARAFMHHKPVLILDDPISQVDIETGNRIINRIKQKAGRMTIIIVSHRLSAVSFADRIVTIEKGRITESGSHAELMENDNFYAGTYRLQALEEELNAF